MQTIKKLLTALVITSVPLTTYAALPGSGTETDPWRIESRAHFDEFAANSAYWYDHISLETDLDLAGTAYVDSVVRVLRGHFNGNGHAISNLCIEGNESYCVALFGESQGEIINFGLENFNISATGSNAIGGICGVNSGTIINCYATGAIVGGYHFVGGVCGDNRGLIRASYANCEMVTESAYIGGLCGGNSDRIISCYANGSAFGRSFVGGLVGANGGTVEMSYSTGDVAGDDLIGGLCGSNGGTVDRCYSTGAVSGSTSVGGLCGWSDFTNASFWELQGSGQLNSAGGKGLSITEMKEVETFENAGWSNSDWVMNDTADYPRLAWENKQYEPIPQAIIPLSGAGTPAEPYEVLTVSDFLCLSRYAKVLSSHIRLMADLDLQGAMLEPIGDLGPFSGHFDGGAHLLSNMTINNPAKDNMGLFAHVYKGGSITDLIIANLTVSGNSNVGGICGISRGTIAHVSCQGLISGVNNVGGICGRTESGVFSNNVFTGTVEGTDYVGGQCGYVNAGEISHCSSASSVTGENYVGGLHGYSYSSQTIESHSSGKVTGTECIGGLSGKIYYDSVFKCSSTCAITGENKVGGLAGENVGELDRSWATGDVQGNYNVGGICGYNKQYIKNCYATGGVEGLDYIGGLCGFNKRSIAMSFANGSASGDNWVGGLCGYNEGGIAASYARGFVTGSIYVGGLCGEDYREGIYHCYSTGGVTGDYRIGGLVGYSNLFTIRRSYWDYEASGIRSGYGTALSTAQMQKMSMFAGWDFVGESIDGPKDIWRMCVDGVDYPRLWWEFAAGDIACPDGVSFSDFAHLADTWMLTQGQPGYNRACDLNADNTVNLADLTTLADNWLTGN